MSAELFGSIKRREKWRFYKESGLCFGSPIQWTRILEIRMGLVEVKDDLRMNSTTNRFKKILTT